MSGVRPPDSAMLRYRRTAAAARRADHTVASWHAEQLALIARLTRGVERVCLVHRVAPADLDVLLTALRHWRNSQTAWAYAPPSSAARWLQLTVLARAGDALAWGGLRLHTSRRLRAAFEALADEGSEADAAGAPRSLLPPPPNALGGARAARRRRDRPPPPRRVRAVRGHLAAARGAPHPAARRRGAMAARRDKTRHRRVAHARGGPATHRRDFAIRGLLPRIAHRPPRHQHVACGGGRPIGGARARRPRRRRARPSLAAARARLVGRARARARPRHRAAPEGGARRASDGRRARVGNLAAARDHGACAR